MCEDIGMQPDVHELLWDLHILPLISAYMSLSVVLDYVMKVIKATITLAPWHILAFLIAYQTDT